MKSTLMLLGLGIMLAALAGCQPASPQGGVILPSQTPTPTTTAEDFHFSGVIESTGSDRWVIGGETFRVDQNTIYDSGLAVGVTARVEYIILSDGTKVAREIETP